MIVRYFFTLYFILSFFTFTVANSNTLFIDNEFIKIAVNNKDAKGRFALETTLGNPENNLDDYQDLIYGKPIPWTSYTTLLIDNNPYIFGDSDKRLKQRTKQTFKYAPLTEQYVTNNSIISSSLIKSFSIDQKIGFYRNPNTNLNDSMAIEYHVTNISDDVHYFGLRLMLDTKLGANDGAPFRMGRDEVNNEILFSQNDLFAYWQAFDSLITPNVISQGLLTDSSGTLTPPDMIHLANWGTLVDHPWNAPYKQDRSFIRQGETQKDTALALTYKSIAVKPKETKIYKTVYGLGGISVSSGELSLGLTAPKSILKTHDSPILIIAYLLNTGSYDAYNIEVTFDLPKNVSIIKGNQTETFPLLQKGKQLQFPLLITVANTKQNSIPLSFSVQSSTYKPNKINHLIKIKKPPKLTIDTQNKLPISQESPYVLFEPIIANNTSIPIKDIEILLSNINQSSLATFEFSSKKIAELLPNTQKKLSWAINTHNLRKPYFFNITAKSNQAINSKKKIMIFNEPKQTPDPVSLYSKSEDTPPYYLTLKVAGLKSTPSHNYVLTYPQKGVQFIDSSSSTVLYTPIAHHKSDRHVLFSPDANKDSYIYFHYLVKDNTSLAFSLLHQSISTPSPSNNLQVTPSLLQTLDLTLSSKNVIVSSNHLKE